jgi:hypothetical protein
MKYSVTATVVVIAVLTASGAIGQTIHGDIEGRVTDGSGAVLAGTAVALESPALPGRQATVADAKGQFRFLILPPGTYTAAFSLAGYQTQQQLNIKVGIDTTVRLDVVMEPAFSGEITVTGESPLVNTTETTIGVDVSKDFFLDLPKDRNYASVATVAPGVQDDRSGQTFYGSTGAENAYYIDGANTTEIERGQQGTELNFEFIDEVQVKSGAYSAQYGHSTGGLVNVITRSGGNEFHGDVFGYYDADSLRAPLSGEAERGAVSDTSRTVGVVRADYGADFGGYFFKDRLWFFAAYDRVDNSDTNEVLEDYGAVVPGAPIAGEQFPYDTTRDLFAFKLTWRPSANHSLSGSIFGDPTEDEGAFPMFRSPPTWYIERILTGGTNGALNYDGVFGQNVVLSARYASHNEKTQQEGLGFDLTGYRDYTDPFGDGGLVFGWAGVESGWGAFYEEDFGRQQFNADLSWFVGNVAGSHELKIGAEYEDLSVVDIRTRSGPVGANVSRLRCNPDFQYCGEDNEHEYYYVHGFWTYDDNIDPEHVMPEDIVKGVAVDTPTENFAAYIQDRWQVTSNLSIDLGVRWSRQKLYNGGGGVQADIDDNWAPRLGFVWDFLGNGRSKLFGHWGRFYESIPMDIVIRAFGGGPNGVNIFNFSDDEWAIQQPPNGEAPRPARVWPGNYYSPIDPNIKGQYMTEAALGAEYELSANVAIGLSLIHRSLDRIVEDALNTDFIYYIGNPGEGMMTHSYDIAVYYADPGGPFECDGGGIECHTKKIPKPRREFDAIELAVRKRFSNNFQFIASAMWSRLEGNYDGNFQASTGQLDPNINSAYDYADYSVNNEGLLSNDRPWQLKFDGIYRFDFGLTTGLSTYYRSGTPVTAMGYCEWYDYWEYYLSERGAFGRTDAEWEADLHLGYPVKLGRELELNLLVDVFNLFNRQGETGRWLRYDWNYSGWEDYQPVNWFTGEANPPIEPGDPDRPPLNPSWNTSRWWQDPRIIRLGLRLSF